MQPSDLNSVARLVLAFDRNPELLNKFKRFGEVPRAFSMLDAEALGYVSSAVEALQNSGQQFRPRVENLVENARDNEL